MNQQITTRRGAGLTGLWLVMGLLLLVAAGGQLAQVLGSVALSPDVTLRERADDHANEKHSSTAIDVVQRDWDPQHIEVYLSLQKQTAVLAKREPSVTMLVFVGIREKISMATALLGITCTWEQITALLDGCLELTHYPMRHAQWQRVQARDGYVRIWPPLPAAQ